MNDIEKIPQASYDLITELDRAIPHRCLQVGMSIEEAWRYAGQRALVDELLAIREEEIELEKTSRDEDRGHR